MDHSSANVFTPETKKKEASITSDFTFQMKEEALSRSEKTMHNKENQLHEAYYKEIGEKLVNFDHVLLFGPTNAKTELHNYLMKDLHFKDIQFDVESSDDMTDNEKVAYVKAHFEKNGTN